MCLYVEGAEGGWGWRTAYNWTKKTVSKEAIHFLWSAIDVVSNIPSKNRYNIVITKYSYICISTDQYFHETL